jgi:iron complex transport system ATP-binding protein
LSGVGLGDLGTCTMEVRSLRARIGPFTLGPLSMMAPPGYVTAVIGPNGSGKTTLIRAIAGLLPHEGDVLLCDRRLPSTPGRGGLIEYVPSEPRADPYAKVREVFEVSAIKAERALSLLPGLERILDRRLNELSSGERKLVCVARGLSSRRPVLLLDEPLSHLDVANQVKMASLIRSVASEGRIVIVSLHELHMIGMLADRLVLLDRGSKVFEDNLASIDSLISDIEKVYGVRIEVIHTRGGIALLAERPRAA